MKFPSQKWHFIKNQQLHDLVVRDYAELKRLQTIKAYKSTILLCGSMLEAILADLLNKPLDTRQDLSLDSLLKEAQAIGMLNSDSYKRADVIRYYRNLIHPKAQAKLKTEIDGDLSEAVLKVFFHILNVLEQTGVTPADMEEQFLRVLAHKCSTAEANTARQIIEWAKSHKFELEWTPALAFMPVLSHNGLGYEPIAINLAGRLFFRLGDLRTPRTPFHPRATRNEFIKRLNDIGMHFKSEQANKFPGVSLAKLEKPERLAAVLGVLDWAVGILRS